MTLSSVAALACRLDRPAALAPSFDLTRARGALDDLDHGFGIGVDCHQRDLQKVALSIIIRLQPATVRLALEKPTDSPPSAPARAKACARIIRPALRLAQNMVNLCGRSCALPIF